MPLPRSDAEILNAHADALKSEMRKCLPGTVTAVDVGKQTVDVQLAINGVLFDELGTAVSTPAPSISGVPVGALRGGGFLIWVPVAVGDSVLLIFSDLSCDTWRAASTGTPVDPGFVGQHTHDSPFAIPMIAPDGKAFSSASPDHVVIGKDGADEQILIGAADIVLGRGATDFVGLSMKIDSAVSAIVGAFNSHTHTYSPGPSPPAPTTPPIIPLGAQPSTAATLVKAK
jgi:hypothetical protein